MKKHLSLLPALLITSLTLSLTACTIGQNIPNEPETSESVFSSDDQSENDADAPEDYSDYYSFEDLTEVPLLWSEDKQYVSEETGSYCLADYIFLSSEADVMYDQNHPMRSVLDTLNELQKASLRNKNAYRR